MLMRRAHADPPGKARTLAENRVQCRSCRTSVDGDLWIWAPLGNGSPVIASVIELPISGKPLAASASPAASGGRAARSLGYLVGPENALLRATIESLLEGEDAPWRSPIVLVGPPGCGKTHLAFGLTALCRLRFGAAAQYIPAIDFARELADAIDTHAVADLRARYRGLAFSGRWTTWPRWRRKPRRNANCSPCWTRWKNPGAGPGDVP